jgi:hypothetical protein
MEMPEKVKTRRKYYSPLRAGQAEQTRRRILEAGFRLFVDRGYAETTIAAVAEEAGVSPELVRRGYWMLDLPRLEQHGRYIVDMGGKHELWKRSPGEPRDGRPLDHAFGINDSHQIVWYEPAGVTIDEVVEADRRAEEQARKAEAEAERERRKRRKSPPPRAIIYAELLICP